MPPSEPPEWPLRPPSLQGPLWNRWRHHTCSRCTEHFPARRPGGRHCQPDPPAGPALWGEAGQGAAGGLQGGSGHRRQHSPSPSLACLQLPVVVLKASSPPPPPRVPSLRSEQRPQKRQGRNKGPKLSGKNLHDAPDGGTACSSALRGFSWWLFVSFSTAVAGTGGGEPASAAEKPSKPSPAFACVARGALLRSGLWWLLLLLSRGSSAGGSQATAEHSLQKHQQLPPETCQWEARPTTPTGAASVRCLPLPALLLLLQSLQVSGLHRHS